MASKDVGDEQPQPSFFYLEDFPVTPSMTKLRAIADRSRLRRGRYQLMNVIQNQGAREYYFTSLNTRCSICSFMHEEK